MNTRDNATVHCCAECGEEGGAVSLKTCKACMLVKYCNADCQRNHWSTHKAECKRRAAELRDEALFKDPPAKEDCSICFLPMPVKLICCVSLPPATITSVPIYDFAIANVELGGKAVETCYECCGKSVCKGCLYSLMIESGKIGNCPFCNSDRDNKPPQVAVEGIMKRVEARDAGAMHVLAGYYHQGAFGLQQDKERAIALWKQAAELGLSQAHYNLGEYFREGGDLKKAKFHWEAAAMAGDEVARYSLGLIEGKSGNMERAVKHWMIAASTGSYKAMHALISFFEEGFIPRDAIESTLTAYNSCCAEMRSEARDASICALTKPN
jgi:tetratricopeptide (TPR) repeat protein